MMKLHDVLSPDTKITQHFRYKELNTRMAPCADSVVLNLIQIAIFLEIVRMSFGKPIRVTSGYRSVQHNKEVGGVKDSMHLRGKAVDIAPFDVADYDTLCFHVTRQHLPKEHYIKFYRERHFIHIHFGTRDDEPIELLPYFPFQIK